MIPRRTKTALGGPTSLATSPGGPPHRWFSLPAERADASIPRMGPIRRLKGDLYLAYRALIAHPLKRLFSTDVRSGKQRFLDNYAPEGLVPMSAEDRRILQEAAR